MAGQSSSDGRELLAGAVEGGEKRKCCRREFRSMGMMKGRFGGSDPRNTWPEFRVTGEVAAREREEEVVSCCRFQGEAGSRRSQGCAAGDGEQRSGSGAQGGGSRLSDHGRGGFCTVNENEMEKRGFSLVFMRRER